MWYALDIETVPAWDEIPEELRPEPGPRSKLDQAGKMATNPMFAKIVYSVMYTDYEFGGPSAVHNSLEGAKEKVLLDNVFSYLIGGREPLSIVTKFGKGFDIPVLLGRGLLLNVLSPIEAGLIRKLYLPKYRTEDTHVDLQDCPELGGLRLDQLAPRILGEHKTGDGSQVEAMVNAGEWDKLGKYCEQDARITWEIAKRFHLMPTLDRRAHTQEPK